MAHPYKRDHRSNGNTRLVETLAVNAIVTTDDSVVTLSYELSLEDVPERFHDEIVSVITMSINPDDNEPMMVTTSEELSENMGNVFMEELVVAIAAINLDIKEFLSTTVTEEKEEVKMDATTTTPTPTAAPVSEVPDLAEAIARLSKQETTLANHDKRLDDIQKDIEFLKKEVKESSNKMNLGDWSCVAIFAGMAAGLGYSFIKK